MTPADAEREARAKAHDLLGDFGGCVSLLGGDEHSLPCERTTAFVAVHAAEVKEAMAGWADMIKRAAGMAERHAAEVAALRGVFAAYVFDRAFYWDESSGIHSALLEVAGKIRRGEAEAAHVHGELDDVLARFAK